MQTCITSRKPGSPGFGTTLGVFLFLFIPTPVQPPASSQSGMTAGLPPSAPTAQLPPSQPYGFRLIEVEKALQAFADTTRVPGFAVSVARKGDFFWSRAWGYADLESGRPMTPTTPLRVGSLSKPMTAALLGVLVEEGTVDLDAPVQQYLPSYPKKEWPVTVRQLAGHLGCVRHYESLAESYSNVYFPTVEASLEPFAGDPLVCEPGTEHHYSTFGYTLLSAVLEKAERGTPFLELMQRRVFGPMGLADTGPDPASLLAGGIAPAGRLEDGVATPYEPGSAGTPVPAPDVDLSNKWAGGGFVSTSEDLARFALGHLDKGLLNPETVELLWTPSRTSSGDVTPYGLGWQSGQRAGGKPFVAHGGNAVGGLSVLILFPEEELVVVFSTNMGNAPIRGVPSRIAGLMVGSGG